MAVYTALDADALAAWIAQRGVGTLVDWRGIAGGIENSNFFVTTRDASGERRFVLTLFERLGDDQLPYYLSLMQHLAAAGLPCPAPIPDADGALHSTLAGKPAALVTRLPGHWIERPEPAHCAAIGATMARLHLAGMRFRGRLPNPRGRDWWLAAADRVRGHLDASRRALLDDEVALQRSQWTATTGSLPRGPIHADLFRDNALFVDDATGAAAPELGGVIDFYFAGDDVWALDVAIGINDWCVDLATGRDDPARRDAFVAAYERERPMDATERAALPLILRAAALRFWLSRLDDLHRPRPAQLLTPHDPSRFERLLAQRRDDMRAGPLSLLRAKDH